MLLLAVAAPAPHPAVAPAPAGVGDSAPLFKYPTGIAVDAAGAVYVASSGDSSVVVFAPGASGRAVPIRRIGGSGSDLVSPKGVALDSRGWVVVSIGGHAIAGKGTITVYAPNVDGNAAPVRTIVGPRTRLETPVGIALGKGGRIYAANGTGNMNLGPNASMFVGANRSDKAVLAFDARANGDAVPQSSLPDTPGSARPTDIAVDPMGNLVTVNGAELTVWGSKGPQRRIFATKTEGGVSGMLSVFQGGGVLGSRPTRVAVGPNGALYSAPRAPSGARATRSGPPSPFDFFFAISSQKTIAIYSDAGSSDTVPQRILAGLYADLLEVTDMAIGKDGSVYILTGRQQSGPPGPRIQVYPPKAEGYVTPVRVIGGARTALKNPVAIAVDGTGRIYVANNVGSDDPLASAATVTVYAPEADGDAAPIHTIVGLATKLLAPTAIAVADDGTLYVANAGVWNDDHGSVRVYAPDADGQARPARTLLGPGTQLISPGGLAISRGDTIYVLGGWDFPRGRTRIAVYPPMADGEVAPIRTIEGDSTGFRESSGMAVDGEGQVYVANRKEAQGINAYGPDLGSVTVFRPGARGNHPPVRTIEGGYTRLNGPSGLAKDRAGNLYVANRWGTGPGSVTVYAPAAEEDVRPIRMIAGPATGLNHPAGVALDAHDTLYVVNERSVTVYAPGATGDASPVRTIGGF
jgi:sugar lactone lactonase YvrE